MNVLGINFQPDFTQIVSGVIKKNKLKINNLQKTYSIQSMFFNLQIDEIAEFFLDAIDKSKIKNPNIYIGLSDDLVKIDCSERDNIPQDRWQITINPWVSQLLQIEEKDYYISTPIVLQKKNRIIVTGAAIRTTFVDILLKAADVAKVNIMSIEPASFGLLRFINQWEQEHCILEVWEKTTSMTSYSPIKGMFKIGLPSFGLINCLEENGSEKLEGKISLHDYSAFETYGLANTNIPIYIASQNKDEITKVLQNGPLFPRLKEIPLLGDFIQAKSYSESEIIEYGMPIGLALYPLHERMIDDAYLSS